MSIRGILFFTLLVTLAITGIHSSPVGGKGSKSPGGKKTVDEYVIDMNERKVPEDVYKNSATNSETVNKPLDAVPGENGYIFSNIAGPSESNPSHKYREDSPIFSTNPLSDALSSTQLKRKREDTESDGATETKASKSTLLSRRIDEIKNKLRNHEARLEEEKNPSWELNQIGSTIPIEDIFKIEIIAPDVISWKTTYDGSFEDIKVPEELKINRKSYKEWFMTKLPDHGFYQDKVGSNEVGKLKSVEQTKTIIKLQDHEKYGFVVPKEVVYVNQNMNAWIMELPERAKGNINKLNKWLRKELPKHFLIELIYNSKLAIEYQGSLKRRN